MVEPTNTPNNIDPIDPNNPRGRSAVPPNNSPVVRGRRGGPWIWIIAVIIILVIIWVFVGWNNRSRVATPVTAPATAASTVR